MYTNQLIELLKSFTNKDLMWFSKFLNSPFFNNRKRIIKLYKVLRRYHPEFEHKNFTKENLYKAVFGKSKYNDSTFRNLMSDLLKLALQYLKQEGMEKKESESSFFIADELMRKGAFQLFKNTMISNAKILDSKKTFDADFFLNKYRTITESFYINLLTRKVIKKPFAVSETEKMINGIAHILTFFILESIKHNDNLLKYSNTYNIKKNTEIVSEFLEIFNFEKLISYIRKHSTVSIPIVEIYYNLIKTFAFFENEKYYQEYKNILTRYANLLGKTDVNFLYARLIDYCVMKKNAGVNCSFDIDLEIFNMYQIYIGKGYYITDSSKYLPFDIYRNVLLNCIIVKNLTYMEEFIKKYSKYLLPEHVHSIVNYSNALLYFEKGIFSNALTCINRIKFDQFVYKIDMKNLQLKINYELGHFESAISNIDTFKHFLNNNVLISESRKILHNNFLTYISKLINFRTGSQKIHLSFVAEKIEKSKNIFDKGWLLDKVNEQLKKKINEN